MIKHALEIQWLHHGFSSRWTPELFWSAFAYGSGSFVFAYFAWPCKALKSRWIYLPSAAFSPACGRAYHLAGTAAQPAADILNNQSFSISVYLKVYRLVVTKQRNPL